MGASHGDKERPPPSIQGTRPAGAPRVWGLPSQFNREGCERRSRAGQINGPARPPGLDARRPGSLRGCSVTSAAQSQKLDRKPCGTAAILSVLSNLDNAVMPSGFPRTLGKHQQADASERTRLLENLQRSTTERDPVLAIPLRA